MNANVTEEEVESAWNRIKNDVACQKYLEEIKVFRDSEMDDNVYPSYVPILQRQNAVREDEELRDIVFVWPNVCDFPPMIKGVSWVRSIE